MNSTCPQMESLGPFMDGELSREGQAAMAEHIQGCLACKAEFGAWNALRAKLEALPADPEARERVFRKLALQPPRRKPVWKTVSMPLPVAAGILLLGAASLVANVYLGLRNLNAPRDAAAVSSAERQTAVNSHAVTIPAQPQPAVPFLSSSGSSVRMNFADSVVEFASETRYRFNEVPKIYAGQIVKSKDLR